MSATPKNHSGAVELSDYQLAAVDAFRARRGKMLLWGATGVGKTFCAAGIIARMEASRPGGKYLVLTTATNLALKQWPDDMAQFFGADVPDITYLNYEKLIIEKYGAEMIAIDWTLVIADESHLVNNPTARRTRIFKRLKSKFRLAMTATPMPNFEWELWSIIDWLKPGCLGTSWTRFKNEEAELDYFGQIKKLKDMEGFREICKPFIWHIPKEVIPDLLPTKKIEVLTPIDATAQRVYDRILNEMCIQLATGEQLTIPNIISQINRLRSLVDGPSYFDLPEEDDHSSCKLLYLDRFCDGVPTIIFAEHTAAIREIYDYLTCWMGQRVLVIDGKTPKGKRKKVAEAFMAGDCDVLVGSSAMEASLNLQRARRVLHYGWPWNNMHIEQRTGRAHRRKQLHEVEEVYFIAPNTMDEKIKALVESKKQLGTKLKRNELLDMVGLTPTRMRELKQQYARTRPSEEN